MIVWNHNEKYDEDWILWKCFIWLSNTWTTSYGQKINSITRLVLPPLTLINADELFHHSQWKHHSFLNSKPKQFDVRIRPKSDPSQLQWMHNIYRPVTENKSLLTFGTCCVLGKNEIKVNRAQLFKSLKLNGDSLVIMVGTHVVFTVICILTVTTINDYTAAKTDSDLGILMQSTLQTAKISRAASSYHTRNLMKHIMGFKQHL